MTEKTRRPLWRKILAGVGIVLGAAIVAALLWALTHPDTAKLLWQNAFAKTITPDTSTDWDGGTSYENVSYSDVSDSDYLHLYVPDSDEPVPLLVCIHGGGFVTNDLESRQAQFMYRYFRDHGYAAATVNYRLAREAAFPAAIEDVKAAVRFLRAHAEEYNLDPDRIAVWGESAGGYLAVMTAITNDDEYTSLPFTGEDEPEEKVSSQVQALVDFYGAGDLGQEKEQAADLGIPAWIRALSMEWVNRYLRGTGYSNVHEYWLRMKADELTDEEYEKLQAAYYIGENLTDGSDLKVLIEHGTADMTVPVTVSEKLAAQLTEALGEDSVTLILRDGLKHAADLFYSDESLAEVKTWLDAALG